MNANGARAIKEIVELFGPLLDGSRGLSARGKLELMLYELAEAIKLDTLEN